MGYYYVPKTKRGATRCKEVEKQVSRANSKPVSEPIKFSLSPEIAFYFAKEYGGSLSQGIKAYLEYIYRKENNV